MILKIASLTFSFHVVGSTRKKAFMLISSLPHIHIRGTWVRYKHTQNSYPLDLNMTSIQLKKHFERGILGKNVILCWMEEDEDERQRDKNNVINIKGLWWKYFFLSCSLQFSFIWQQFSSFFLSFLLFLAFHQLSFVL
jgi:hypothetical protein